jgi:hypothetical protein
MPLCTLSPSARLCELVDALVDAAPIPDATKPLWRAFGRRWGESCLAAALDVAAVAAMASPRREPGRFPSTHRSTGRS